MNKEHLLWRYATKQFDPNRTLSDADLQDLIDSVRFAPSSYGLQPWHFLVIDNKEIRQQLQPHCWNQAQVTDCSQLFVLCAKTSMDEAYVDDFAKNVAQTRGVSVDDVAAYVGMMKGGVLEGKTDADRQTWMEKQVYIALGFLMHTCMDKKIDACPMEGFLRDEVNAILGLEEKGLTAVVLCPVGYRSEDDKYAQLPKVRWEESDVVERIS